MGPKPLGGGGRYSLGSCDHLTFAFHHTHTLNGATATQVELTTDDSTWISIGTYSGIGGGKVSIDATPEITGASRVRFGFRFRGGSGDIWRIDDVKVVGNSSDPDTDSDTGTDTGTGTVIGTGTALDGGLDSGA